ncbi:Arc family DNA-binding protein [Acidovorax citrulli]|nr:Arc family DNA-binding protein [Paracidovorax citrulli]
MKQTDPQYKLRIPPDLKEQIETAAKESGRSMNAEIVARLEDSFAARNDGTVLAAMDVVRRGVGAKCDRQPA